MYVCVCVYVYGDAHITDVHIPTVLMRILMYSYVCMYVCRLVLFAVDPVLSQKVFPFLLARILWTVSMPIAFITTCLVRVYVYVCVYVCMHVCILLLVCFTVLCYICVCLCKYMCVCVYVY